MKINYFFLLFLILLLSCSKPNRLNNISISSIPSAEKLEISDVFSSYEIIILEELHEDLVYNIDKLYSFEDNLFVADIEFSQTLFIFNENGKLLHAILSGIGGPGEFTEISDFSIEEEAREIWVYSEGQSKIFIYDFEGDFLRDYKIPFDFFAHFIAPLGDEKVAIFRDIIVESDSKAYESQLLAIDLKTMELIDQAIPIGKGNLLIAQDNAFTKVGDQIFTIKAYDNTVYKIESNGEIDKHLVFEEAIDLDFYSNMTDLSDLLNRLKESQSNAFANRFLTNGDHLFGYFNRAGKLSFLYGSKNQENLTFYNRIDNDMGDFQISDISYISEDAVYAVINEEMLMVSRNQNPMSDFVKALDSLNQDISPVIVKFKIR